MATAPAPCAVCGTTAYKICSGCRSAHYCGQEHQLQDWSHHKVSCCAVPAASQLCNVCRKPQKSLQRLLQCGHSLCVGCVERSLRDSACRMHGLHREVCCPHAGCGAASCIKGEGRPRDLPASLSLSSAPRTVDLSLSIRQRAPLPHDKDILDETAELSFTEQFTPAVQPSCHVYQADKDHDAVLVVDATLRRQSGPKQLLMVKRHMLAQLNDDLMCGRSTYRSRSVSCLGWLKAAHESKGSDDLLTPVRAALTPRGEIVWQHGPRYWPDTAVLALPPTTVASKTSSSQLTLLAASEASQSMVSALVAGDAAVLQGKVIAAERVLCTLPKNARPSHDLKVLGMTLDATPVPLNVHSKTGEVTLEPAEPLESRSSSCVLLDGVHVPLNSAGTAVGGVAASFMGPLAVLCGSCGARGGWLDVELPPEVCPLAPTIAGVRCSSSSRAWTVVEILPTGRTRVLHAVPDGTRVWLDGVRVVAKSRQGTATEFTLNMARFFSPGPKVVILTPPWQHVTGVLQCPVARPVWKTVLLIRHGQAQHNRLMDLDRWDEAKAVRDPQLTQLGRQEVTRLRGQLAEMRRVGIVPQVVLCSPMTRALQTCLGAFGGSNVPVHVCARHTEHGGLACDTGRPASELSREFQGLHFDHLAEEWWARTETHDEMMLRINKFARYLAGRSESVIAVVGHGGFLRHMMRMRWIDNCSVVPIPWPSLRPPLPF